ncbi:Protoglobin-domain-containing protein [Podospora conica]|nr:Protoglobin-domain-containing protein [Schizothecium conicum]
MPSPRNRPMQHIDRKALYTDLEARVEYLQSFLDFGQSDIDALISGRKYIQALIPAVVNIVYKKLLQYDITARAFTTRSTAFEGPMDDVPDEESPQILHRKKFLGGYLKKLCSDPAQMEFFEYLDKVGMMHTGIGRANPLHIEYVHIGAALGVIQDVFNEALLSHPRLSMQRKLAMIKALGKVIWIQNDLFAKWYVHDGEEYTAGVDYAPVVEKEGWLKGKKVLDDVDDEVDGAGKAGRGNESDGSDDTAVTPGRRAAGLKGGCPFAGIVAGGKKVTFDEGRAEEVEAK